MEATAKQEGTRSGASQLAERIFKPGKKTVAAFFAYFFYTVWIHFNFFSSDALTVSGNGTGSLAYAASVYVNGAVLIALALLYRRYERHVFDSGVVVASIFLCTLGTLLSVSEGIFIDPAAWIGAVSGSLTGIGSAMLLMMLAVLLVQNGGYTSTVLYAFILANAATLPLELLPSTPLLVIVILLPALSIACAFTAREGNEVPRSEASAGDVRSMVPLIVRAAVFVLVIYTAVSMMNTLAQANGTSPNGSALALVSAIVLAFMVASSLAEGAKLSIVSVYRMVFLLAVAALLGIPFFGGRLDIAMGLCAVLTTAVRALIFIIEYRICVKTGLSPLIVFGIGETIKKLPSIAVHSIVPLGVLQGIYFDPMVNMRVASVFTLVLVAVYVLVFTEKNLLQLSKDDRSMGASQLIERSRMRVAQKYGLTDRETEVFLHLCEGRSAPWIAKELYISQSTVNVHIKNIYKKCGVHSRQALLDLAKS